MNPEREPRYQFPWRTDEQGEYLVIRSDAGDYEIRQETTLLYLFPGEEKADHIFIFTHEEDGMVMGARVWRKNFDKILGEGAFSSLCEQLFERDFRLAPDEEPSELDIQAWEQTFGEPYNPPTPIDKIVELAMANFEAEAEYYLEHEWK